ncbi:MAG: hypothetical protein J7621_06785 [Niastella sp.]|nr:hypothetical protein [Niastella sp.]
MDAQATPQQDPNRGMEPYLIGLVCVAWVCMIVLLYLKNKNDVSILLTELGVYGAGAGSIFLIIDRVKKQNRFWNILRNVLYLGLFILIVLQIFNIAQVILTSGNKEKNIPEIIKEVEENTRAYKQGIYSERICKDCKEVGIDIKQYRDNLTDSLLAREGIHGKSREKYKLKIDSILIDPVAESCHFAQYHDKFVKELRLLIRQKDITRIDKFLQKYNIAQSARSIILIEDNQKVSFSTFRNHIIDIIQGTRTMFNATYLPAYSTNKMVEEVFFINN